MKQKLDRQTMAMRVAMEFQDGDVINLGAGIPTLCAGYLPEDREVFLQSENGVLGYGSLAEEGERDSNLINASGEFVTLRPGISFFSSAEAFNMIRSGHIDIAVLGAYQVSERGDLANWMLPHRGTGNIGGAIELVVGAKRVIAVMEHTTRNDEPKLVRRCTYPLTSKECVKLVVTDISVVEVTKEGFLLVEVAPGFTPEEVQSMTEAPLIVSPDLKEIEL
ncbi:MAG: 3-oxoacid CoA-transferase subunit B [Dehalococcoidia bacterium]